MADTFSTTTINGKKCTAVPRANNVIGGQPAASTSAAPTSTSTSSSSTSTSTSTSTSSSSSSSSSTPTSSPIAISTSAAASVPASPTDVAALPPSQPPPPVANPALSEATSSVAQETTASTTSSSSFLDVVSSAAPPTQALQNPAIINAPFPVPTPSTSSLSSPTPDVPLSTEITSTSLSSPPPSSPSINEAAPLSAETPSTSISLESVTQSETTEALATATQSGDTVAATLTSDAQSGASTQTGEGTNAGAAATTAATTTTGDGSPLESQATGAAGLPDSSQKSATGMGISNETTVAVASGVIGGLAVVSLIGFLIWFWRKRTMKKRRSTLLTPLTAERPYRGKEKDEQYVISRTSLGPTPFPEKFRAMVSYNYQRLRGRVNGFVESSPSPSVNLNRGNSQFGPLDTPESRSASRNENLNDNTPPTAKDRFVDWWGRLTEDANMNWRLQSEPKSNRNDNDPFAVTRSMKEGKPAGPGSQPDFLTLVSRDNQQARGPGNADNSDPPRRRSISVGNEHFLGGLGLSFDDVDPFSDGNAISRNSARVAPLTVSGANNPFSDANAIAGPSSSSATRTGPTTYVQNMRHSRGHSVSGAGNNRPGAGPPPRVSVASNRSSGVLNYRESGASVESFETRRNKFRSDPFDLDRPELLQVGPGATVAVSRNASAASKKSRRGSRGYIAGPGPETPRRAHVRTESYSSKYSSGVSSIGDDWSDPGPDVGPGTGSGRWDGGSGNDKPTRTKSGGSQGSVGKAL